MDTRPLILTLKIDQQSQIFFNRLRKLHFPAGRNYLNAHLTLFHHLPATSVEAISTELKQLAATTTAFNLSVETPKNIGRGVAYPLASPALMALHRQLQTLWLEHLTPQDQQKPWPHITVQNKVAPEQAKALQIRLSSAFRPFAVLALGFELYRYNHGPWEWVSDIFFRNI